MTLPSVDAKAIVRAIEGLAAAITRTAQAGQSGFALSSDAPQPDTINRELKAGTEHCDEAADLTSDAGQLRDQIAAAIYQRHNPDRYWVDARPHDRSLYSADADAVLTLILPGTRAIAGLARSADADVQRVIALYEQWLKAGPPPLGASMARWWDLRLIELRQAILPATDETKEQ